MATTDNLIMLSCPRWDYVSLQGNATKKESLGEFVPTEFKVWDVDGPSHREIIVTDNFEWL